MMGTTPQRTSNPFAGIGKAEATGAGGAYLLEGVHGDLEIKACRLIFSVNKKVDMFIVEFIVHETTNAAMAVGSTRSWIVNFQHPSALGNIKNFLVAATNASDESEIDEDLSTAVVADDQPLRGIHVKAESVVIETRRGTPFTKTTFEFLRAA